MVGPLGAEVVGLDDLQSGLTIMWLICAVPATCMSPFLSLPSSSSTFLLHLSHLIHSNQREASFSNSLDLKQLAKQSVSNFAPLAAENSSTRSSSRAACTSEPQCAYSRSAGGRLRSCGNSSSNNRGKWPSRIVSIGISSPQYQRCNSFTFFLQMLS